MKSSQDSTDEYFRAWKFLPKTILAGLVLELLLAFVALSLQAGQDTNSLEIQSISVNGKSLPFRGKESVHLASSPEDIVFALGPDTNVGKPPLRLRYTLEGFENT